MAVSRAELTPEGRRCGKRSEPPCEVFSIRDWRFRMFTVSYSRAHIHEDLFELEVPDDFQPHRFDHPATQPA